MTQTTTIRPTTLADLQEIDVLFRRSYPALLKTAYLPSVLVTAVPLISKAQPQLLASGTYFAVTEGDRIVGAGGWTRAAAGGARPTDPDVGHIRHVVTSHNHVRQGIGRRLMTHIFASAQAHGVKRLECQATLMAEPFYAAVGFIRIKPITLTLRAGIEFPAVYMTRPL